MIETVSPAKENQQPVSEEADKGEPPVTSIEQATDEKANETNVLFQHLPSFYDEDEDDKCIRMITIEAISCAGDNSATPNTVTTVGNAAKKARLEYPAYNLDLKMNQVLPRLFISDDVIARNKAMLVKYQITHILNLTTNIPNKFEPDITYLKLVVFDFETQNISQYFSESFEFIENAFKQNESNRVLVHCNAGISRSASFVIAYLLQKRLFKRYKDAYNHLKKARPVIEPNRGFEKQLINFEKRIKKNKGCSIM